MKEIIIVAALAENHAMGRQNDLPWHLPKDFAHFKSLTSGHPIIMGRKTLDSLPGKLKNRGHIVISNNPEYKPKFEVEGVATSIQGAIDLCKDSTVFIVGGAQIYALALPLATKMVLTHVKATFEADTFFPEFASAEWKRTHSEYFSKDEQNLYDFEIVTYERV
jgi:dihydrofolate reductase